MLVLGDGRGLGLLRKDLSVQLSLELFIDAGKRIGLLHRLDSISGQQRGIADEAVRRVIKLLREASPFRAYGPARRLDVARGHCLEALAPAGACHQFLVGLDRGSTSVLLL